MPQVPAPSDESGGAGGSGRPGGPGGPGGPGDPGGGKQAALSRDLSGFLVEFSIAIQKHAIYPQGHPLLDEAVDGVMTKLAALVAERPALSIGVARKQLIIDGIGTDPNHPLLKELAGRLHKHELGAIKISQGFTRDELGDMLATVAPDPVRGEPALGQAPDLAERWQNVRLFPLHYERLELQYDGTDAEGDSAAIMRGSSRPAQLWVGMARAALMVEDGVDLDDESLSPFVVAEAVDGRQEEAYDQVIVGYMLQISEELKTLGGSPEALELQKRVSEMVKQLSPETIRRLLRMGGDPAQRRQFLLNAAQGMTVEAVLELVQAASTGGKQTISHSMLRLFNKLSKYAETDADPMRRANAEQSVREQMTKLISEWQLEDPNPTEYGKALQTLARKRRAESSNPYTDCEPERILQMAFELGTGGPRFDVALQTLLNQGRLDPVLDLIEDAPDAEFAESVWSYLDSTDVLWSVLTAPRPDFVLIERLVRRKRLAAVEPVLDVVERTTDLRTRERFLDLLLELGDDVGPSVARRLDGSRTETRRDLFLLLGKLKNIPDGFDASRFLMHSDPAVRREAVRLLLKFVQTREQAIVAGVADTDERAVYYGLSAAQEGGCPPRAVPIIRQRLTTGDLDSALVTLAIRVLAAADSGVGPVLSGSGRTSQMMRAVASDDDPAATAAASRKTLEWLMGRVAQKSRFRRQWKLQPKGPEMLAALSALAAYWSHDPDVQEILSVAVKANDPELRKALGAQRVTGRFTAVTE